MKFLNLGLAKVHKIAMMAITVYFTMRLGSLNNGFLYKFAQKQAL